MTDLLRSVVTIIDVFYKYTSQDEECATLSTDELKELLEKEFRPILKNPDDPDTVDVIMHMLDRDHDRRLDFNEFLLMVFKLAMACNKVLSKEYCKASGSKKQKHGNCHRHPEEESETEEEDEETSGQKSGYKNLSRMEEEKQATVRSVTVKASQESPMDTQGPVIGSIDLNMDSLDPLAEGDRDLPRDNQETPAHTLRLPMGNLHTQDPTAVEEGKHITVRTVTVKASQESLMDTQGPVMARLHLNMDSLDPLAEGDRDLPRDNQETPADTLSLPMGNLHTQDPTAVEEGKQVTVRSVTVKASQ
ncbi:hypothetical protein HJG60_005161 [Phyllostomus discolor]|uniref:EF-hand domain-containing protein n=1 Tax=Phyllostomus discolor TaxID=89673 RepID=A0A833YHH4_9CHIR|nr:hypothetical protein HJG60_005161 [Phyllostomus discolor]